MTEKSIAAPKESPAELLDAIESAIRTLMLEKGRAEHELQDRQEKHEAETKAMLLEFISCIDALRNTLDNINPKLDNADKPVKLWVNSFRTVHKMFIRALNAQDVVPIDAVVGEEANPFWHSIAETVPLPGKNNGTIVEVLKPGYLWKGRKLRLAEVIVVKND